MAASPRPRLRAAFVLTAAILGIELAGGLLAHSLALLADAGHALTDVVAIGLAWFAAARAARPSDARRTFGYHRAGILVALANALALLVVVAAIGVEAVLRLRSPEQVDARIVIAAASAGLLVNSAIALGLRGHAGHDLNVRAALLHVLGDVAASLGVLVAGGIILATGRDAADPAVSLAVALLVARGAWSLLREASDVLMEGVPRGIDLETLVRDLRALPGVDDVHDLHVWSVAGGMTMLSAHVSVGDDATLGSYGPLLARADEVLRDHGVRHSTIQLEAALADPCPPDLYCSLDTAAPPAGQAERSAARSGG